MHVPPPLRSPMHTDPLPPAAATPSLLDSLLPLSATKAADHAVYRESGQLVVAPRRPLDGWLERFVGWVIGTGWVTTDTVRRFMGHRADEIERKIEVIDVRHILIQLHEDMKDRYGAVRLPDLSMDQQRSEIDGVVAHVKKIAQGWMQAISATQPLPAEPSPVKENSTPTAADARRESKTIPPTHDETATAWEDAERAQRENDGRIDSELRRLAEQAGWSDEQVATLRTDLLIHVRCNSRALYRTGTLQIETREFRSALQSALTKFREPVIVRALVSSGLTREEAQREAPLIAGRSLDTADMAISLRSVLSRAEVLALVDHLLDPAQANRGMGAALNALTDGGMPVLDKLLRKDAVACIAPALRRECRQMLDERIDFLARNYRPEDQEDRIAGQMRQLAREVQQKITKDLPLRLAQAAAALRMLERSTSLSPSAKRFVVQTAPTRGPLAPAQVEHWEALAPYASTFGLAAQACVMVARKQAYRGDKKHAAQPNHAGTAQLFKALAVARDARIQVIKKLEGARSPDTKERAALAALRADASCVDLALLAVAGLDASSSAEHAQLCRHTALALSSDIWPQLVQSLQAQRAGHEGIVSELQTMVSALRVAFLTGTNDIELLSKEHDVPPSHSSPAQLAIPDALTESITEYLEE